MYIHYGSKHFDNNQFNEVKNIGMTKPQGGLWASRVDAKYGWKDWLIDQGYDESGRLFKPYKEENSFRFKLKEGTKVLHIETIEELVNNTKQVCPAPLYSSWHYIDFEELKTRYDAIEVIISKTFHKFVDECLYFKLYTWDCDSILILNKDIVEEIK